VAVSTFLMDVTVTTMQRTGGEAHPLRAAVGVPERGNGGGDRRADRAEVRGTLYRESWLTLAAIAQAAPSVLRMRAVGDRLALARRQGKGVVEATVQGICGECLTENDLHHEDTINDTSRATKRDCIRKVLTNAHSLRSTTIASSPQHYVAHIVGGLLSVRHAAAGRKECPEGL